MKRFYYFHKQSNRES